MAVARCVTIDQVLGPPVPLKPFTLFMGVRANRASPVANHFMKRAWRVVRPSGAVRASQACVVRGRWVESEASRGVTGFRRSELLSIPPPSKEP
jgi:hypothetical protein